MHRIINYVPEIGKLGLYKRDFLDFQAVWLNHELVRAAASLNMT